MSTSNYSIRLKNTYMYVFSINYIQNGCKPHVEHVLHVLHVDTDSLWVGTYLGITYVRYFFSSKHCVVFKVLAEETLTNRKTLVVYVFFKNNVNFFICVYTCEILKKKTPLVENVCVFHNIHIILKTRPGLA